VFWKQKFASEVIVTYVRRYLRFCLSLRDLQQLMAECRMVAHDVHLPRIRVYGPEGSVATIITKTEWFAEPGRSTLSNCRKARNGRPCSASSRRFSGLSFSAGGEGDREDQSDSARLGEVLCHKPLEPVFLIHPILGRKEASAPSGPGVPASRIRREAVEQGMAVRSAGTLLGVPRLLRAAQLGSRPSLIDLINLVVNCAGARSAEIRSLRAMWRGLETSSRCG
jgi:hypothetical protein